MSDNLNVLFPLQLYIDVSVVILVFTKKPLLQIEVLSLY